MKLRRFLSSCIFLLVCVPAFCCGPYWYAPEDYYMFRIYEAKPSSLANDGNCLDWQSLTSMDISLSDIGQVVYKYPEKKLSALLDGKSSQNTFERYLAAKNDTEIRDYLVTAKRCEIARAEMNDPWYYPAKNDPVVAALEDVVETSLSYDGKRLEDRYILQAVRALTSLERYDSIDSLWKVRSSHLRESYIKNMAGNYVAGANFNLGRSDKALELFKETGDLGSLNMLFTQYRSRTALLEFAAKECPDADDIPYYLQALGSEYETMFSSYYNWINKDNKKPEIKKFLAICLNGGSRAKNAAPWYYTAAYLSDLLGDTMKASSILAKAESSKMDQFTEESVRIMRMYLDAKNCTYNEAYRQKLFKELKWLDKKIETNITDNVKSITANGWQLHISNSYYYWNDMMRKILIGYVSPKMVEAGYPVMALRLCNMADNRLLSLVDCYETNWYDGKWNETPKRYTLSEYRSAPETDNMFDYSNYFFEAMDTLAIQNVISYEKSMGNGATEFEKFLDARGYINHDYVREVIGTRYLREKNYKKAAQYLSLVSPAYEKMTNVSKYYRRKPFVYGNEKWSSPKSEYKLTFARKMSELEGKMKSGDPDVSGSAMIEYGFGLRSSFDYCWTLTQYHLNSGDPWLVSEYRKRTLSEAEALISKGLGKIKDRETAAKAYLSLYRYITVAEKFSDTKTGRQVISQCDKLYDHQTGKYWHTTEYDDSWGNEY